MKTDSVWIADLPRDGSNVVTDLDFDREEPARKAIKLGEDPRSEDLPIIAFEKYRDGPIEKLPQLFEGSGGLVLSGKLAAPLLKFDLGRTLVLPLKIFKYDRRTEIFGDREYYINLRVETFKALAPEACRHLRADKWSPQSWLLPRTRAIQDDDIAVAPNALDSPAVWWDPALPEATFLNGEVVAAMHENGTAKFWNLKRCRVLRLN